MNKTIFAVVREIELIEVIKENSDNNKLDISDLNLAWSFWDDNETEHNDDNVAYTLNIESISIEIDCNGAEMVMVTFDDDSTQCWGNVDCIDDDGNNMGEYIYSEVFYYYN